MARLKSRKTPAAKRSRRRTKRRAPAPSAHVTEASLVAYAHDIRTALTGILALGELLASSNLGERERHWASEIKDSAEHLAALTTLMIDAAKTGAGALVLQQEVFRPQRLIAALADSLAARTDTKGLASALTVAEDVPEALVGDAVRLRAALENLIDNAVKFTASGAVKLDARCARATPGHVRLVFTVTDSGIGLKPAEIKRLFRPFAQANADIARRYGGAGLGLAIVKALAKLMGGDLTVTSTFGLGASFRFSAVLPRAQGDVGGSATVRQPPAATHRLAVLYAEDNPYGRVILNTILGELGHRADFVSNGEEAVAAVARGYDVVLMDVTLPGIDGLEATRRIRALGGAAALTPIIGISGRGGSGDEQAARAAGMDFYLRKPVSPSALNEAIAAVLKDKRAPRGLAGSLQS
jgi:CheY-like chemotaxis protein/nitrogen-specific signal transduction histidine kinase